MKRIAFLLFLFSAACAFSQQAKKYPSLLWKITGKDLKKPSYLYGTMHVSNRVAYYLSEQFFDALKSVDVVGLETNPGEWLQNMEETGELAEITQVRDQNLNRNFYKTAFSLSFPDKRVFQNILSYDPDIINGLLYRQNKSRENFEESTYIDLFIFQTASKLNKKVISLEDFATSEIKARLSALPDEEERPEAYGMYGNAQKIEDAYREGNLDMLDSLSKLASGKNMQRFLIDERNVSFAETIDSVMRQHTIFSGVGAAHLPGENGVIELLRRKGYTVQPVEPSVSRKANQQREEIDQQFRPVTFSRQYPADSLFSVELPGKMFSIYDAGQLKYLIHPDMVNGSFYTIVRLRHFGPLFNVSAEQVRKKVDSLLFEHIPGRILQKNEVAAGNVPGIEVINRTRQGDEQHYRIFFTAQEMIMFKLGGRHSYATGEEAKKFFSSITFYSPPEKPQAYAPPTGGFTVEVPGAFHYQKYTNAGVTGAVEDLFGQSGSQVYGIRHCIYNDFDYLEDDTFELNQLASGVLESYGFNLEKASELKKHGSLPAILFSGKNVHGSWLSAMIVIKDVHYYLVYQHASQKPGHGSPFFKSFVLGDFRYVHPIREVRDAEFGFRVLDEVTADARSRFNEAYQEAYNKSRPAAADTANDPYSYKSGSKFYYSPSSQEYVSISYERFSAYDSRLFKETEKQIESNYRANTTMFVSRKKRITEGDRRELRYTLADTATTRALEVRVIFKGSAMHQLTAPYDTTMGLAGWKKSFLESYTPIDSPATKDLFTDGLDQMLSDIAGSDTSKRQSANRALRNGLGLQPHQADKFIRFLKSPQLAQVNEDSRAQLFVNGGTMGSEGIIGPYRTLYMQYTDSFYLQLCLLKGLAYLKTPAAYKAFSELILKEPPLTGDESSIRDVLLVLRDSLQLCRPFFPALLTLTRYEEFRNPVYALLADLADQKLINAQKYIKQKEVIITDAMLALKRYNPAAKAENDDGSLSHLDKAAREIADNIRRSLDGLTNNMMYRSGDASSQMSSADRHPLVSYAYILAPLAGKDPKAREYFTKLMKVKTQEILMPVAVNLLRYGETLSDSLASRYSRDPHTRAYFYSELEKHGLEEHFDARYRSQEKLVESLIQSHRQLNSLYYEKDNRKRDSLSLIKIFDAQNKYQKGKLYVYRSGRPRVDEQWSAVFVPAGTEGVTSRMELLSAAFYADPAKTQEENLNDLLSFFRLSYRKRALVNSAV